MWFMLLGCPAPTPTRQAPISVELDAASLEEVTRRLVDIGPRMVGTPAEGEAEREVFRMFFESGLEDVHFEPFTWDAWAPGPATIRVGDQVYPAEALSPSPPMVGVELPLARDGVDPASGAAVLTTNRGTSRGFQAVLLNGAGAGAMVRITEERDRDDGPLIEVGHTFMELDFTSLSVDADTGAALRAAAGQTAVLDVDTLMLPDHVSRNVVGEIPGSGNRIVYVTAHLDSWHPSESAADNALGVGAMVLLARKLAVGPTPLHTVRFVATGAEEQGLQGALAYVDAHPQESGASPLVLNLDVLWASEGTFVVMSDRDRWFDVAMASAEREGIEAVEGGVPGPGSDNFPFQIGGADAFWAGRFGYREYHTEHDTLDRLNLNRAAAALRIQWDVLASEVYE